MSAKELDPYAAKAESNNVSPQEKIDGLHAIVKSVKTGMLSSRSSSGQIHSRAMAPAGREYFVLSCPLSRLQMDLSPCSGGAQSSLAHLHREPRDTQV